MRAAILATGVTAIPFLALAYPKAATLVFGAVMVVLVWLMLWMMFKELL